MYLLRTLHPMFHLLMSGLRLSDLNKETTYLLTYHKPLFVYFVFITNAYSYKKSTRS